MVSLHSYHQCGLFSRWVIQIQFGLNVCPAHLTSDSCFLKPTSSCPYPNCEYEMPDIFLLCHFFFSFFCLGYCGLFHSSLLKLLKDHSASWGPLISAVEMLHLTFGLQQCCRFRKTISTESILSIDFVFAHSYYNLEGCDLPVNLHLPTAKRLKPISPNYLGEFTWF